MQINGTNYPTVSEAAPIFQVSVKTLRGWIEDGIISQPPQINHGLRTIDIFPPDYIEKAKAELEQYRKNKRKQHKNKTKK